MRNRLLPQNASFIALFLWLQSCVVWFVGKKKKSQQSGTGTSEIAYKGSRPNAPRTVAIIWAEDKVNESSVKQLVNIIQWCGHEQLETLYVYDPSGILKLKASQLRSELSGQHWNIQVGWRLQPVSQALTCEACRSKKQEEELGASASCTAIAACSQLAPTPSTCSIETRFRRVLLPEQQPSSLCALSAMVASGPPDPFPELLSVSLGQTAPHGICQQLLTPLQATSFGGGCTCEAYVCCAARKCETPLGCSSPLDTADLEGVEVPASWPTAASAEATALNGLQQSPQKLQQCSKSGKSSLVPRCKLSPVSERQARDPADSPTSACSSDNCEPPRSQVAVSDATASKLGKHPPAFRSAAGAEGSAVLHRRGTSCVGAGVRGALLGLPTGIGSALMEAACKAPCHGRDEASLRKESDGGAHEAFAHPVPSAAAAATGSGEGDRACERREGCVRVLLLSAEDGYAPVLSVARTGGVCSRCGAVAVLKSGPYREGLSRLWMQMAQLAGPAVLVRPELVLVVGPVLTLAGFPPLQVATSEILHLGPSRRLCRALVDAALVKFLRTEQRFGS